MRIPQEFDQKTSIKRTLHEIQAQTRENNIKINSHRLWRCDWIV